MFFCRRGSATAAFTSSLLSRRTEKISSVVRTRSSPSPMASAISSPPMTVSARKVFAPNCSTNGARVVAVRPLHEWRQRFPIAGGPSGNRIVRCGHGRAGGNRDTLASLEKQNDADWIAAAMPAEKTPTGFQPDLVQSIPGRRRCRLRVYLIRTCRDRPDTKRFAADWVRLFGVRGRAGGLWRLDVRGDDRFGVAAGAARFRL